MRILLILSLLFLVACKQTPKQYAAKIQFETMGTFGTVKLVDSFSIDDKKIARDIDSLFIHFNLSLSTYIDSSTLSRYNSGESVELDNYIYHCLNVSEKIFEETNGAFNPHRKAIFDYWKYLQGPIDSSFIDSLKMQSIYFLRYDTISLIDPVSLPEKHGVNAIFPIGLDFSAIAKGYGVDVIAFYLDSLGIENYMVEIGGEVHCKGKNEDGNFWRLGIEEPNEETRSIYEVVQLENRAMATSGNYRNFKVLENGQKVVHIINPKTGYPEISNLLSASILADDCMLADAYATACMVMGVDTCFQFVLNHPSLDCYLIYTDENGNLQSKSTDGFKKILVE